VTLRRLRVRLSALLLLLLLLGGTLLLLRTALLLLLLTGEGGESGLTLRNAAVDALRGAVTHRRETLRRHSLGRVAAVEVREVRGRGATVRVREVRRGSVVHSRVVTGVSAAVAVGTGVRSGVHRLNAVELSAVSAGHELLLVVSSSSTVVTSSTSTVTHVVARLALDLGLDALAVGRVADHREDGADRLDELGALSGLGVVESGLDDVVGEGVAKETLETLLDEELVDDGATTGGISDTDALLDDVRGELLRRESRDVAEELADDSLNEAVVVEVEDVLDDVVSLRVQES
jgi:hypothetical protein